jgi:hypothetical protein
MCSTGSNNVRFKKSQKQRPSPNEKPAQTQSNPVEDLSNCPIMTTGPSEESEEERERLNKDAWAV